MTLRFPQLFAAPATIQQRTEAMLNESPNPPDINSEPPTKRKRKSLSKLLLDLLRPRKPTPHESQLAAKCKLPLLPGRQSTLALPVAVASPFSHHIHRSTISISSLPLPSQKPRSPSALELGMAPSIHDSKFSSVASESTLSFHTASSSNPPSTLILSPRQLARLSSLSRRLNRALRRQEVLTQSFGENVAFLMGRKETSVELSRRLNGDVRRGMLALMRGLRALVGQCFLRKAAFLQRSCDVARGISEQITNSRHAADGLACAVSGNQEIRLDIEAVLAGLATLRDDVLVQRGLDAALRAGVAGPCGDVKLPASENERIGMHRFVVFIDGRLGVLASGYGRLDGIVDRFQLLLMALKTD